MAITPADVYRIAPEFAGVPVDEVEQAIADSRLQMNATAWGTRLDAGNKFFAAHLLALVYPAKIRNETSGESVGGVSRSASVKGSYRDATNDRFEAEYRKMMSALGLSFTTDYGVTPSW